MTYFNGTIVCIINLFKCRNIWQYIMIWVFYRGCMTASIINLIAYDHSIFVISDRVWKTAASSFYTIIGLHNVYYSVELTSLFRDRKMLLKFTFFRELLLFARNCNIRITLHYLRKISVNELMTSFICRIKSFFSLMTPLLFLERLHYIASFHLHLHGRCNIKTVIYIDNH